MASEPQKTWLDEAEDLSRGAQKAMEEGNILGSLALALTAAKCLQIHRNLNVANGPDARSLHQPKDQ